jgi:hypothetical protein
MPLVMPPTMQLMLPTSRGTLPQIQDAMQELSLLGSMPIVQKEVEIAPRANYNHEHGVPDALNANNPIQATDLRIMHDQELLLIMLHHQVRGQSTISQLSHDVFGRSDTPKTSSLQLRSTTVPPTQVYGSRCTI